MGLVKKIKFSNLSKEKTTRFDLPFIHNMDKAYISYYTYHDLFDVIEYTKLDITLLDNIIYAEIGDIAKTGEVNPVQLSFDNRHELNENYFKKIEKGDIIKPLKDDILLSKIRPYLNKIVLIKTQNIFYTKAMIQIRPKINSKLFYYLLRSTFLNLIIAVSRQGKGYPTLKEDDLKSIRFNKPYIDKIILNETILVTKIESREEEIKNLKIQRIDSLKIISDVFSKEFNIDLEEVKKLDNIKQFNLKLKYTILKNDLLRTSFKWHKLEIIQSYMHKDIKCIKKLSKFITSTKNGWSPQSSEVEGGTPVLGQEHILKNGQISLSASKFTTLTRNNIENFYIKQNNFFVSRGNTVELVALAGLVTDNIEDDILYPDLYIKIDFDEKYINKQYMAYLFNSFFGRIYFKHVAKGKNQTMVKVSSKELYDFHVPLPNKTIQQEIVTKIQTQLNSQKEIDKQIENKQGEISKIIEDCIKDDLV